MMYFAYKYVERRSIAEFEELLQMVLVSFADLPEGLKKHREELRRRLVEKVTAVSNIGRSEEGFVPGCECMLATTRCGFVRGEEPDEGSWKVADHVHVEGFLQGASQTSGGSIANVFQQMKDRIGGMQVRYVEEPDCNRQALLEIYATLTLRHRHPIQRFDKTYALLRGSGWGSTSARRLLADWNR